ncbi:25244_t:CDS:2, partial [Gigaspora rosea]
LGFEFGKAFPNIFNNTPANSGNSKAKGSYNRAMPRTLFLVPAGLLLNKAFSKGNIEYVYLARQVALERAYVVRVANEVGWNVIAKMASGNLLDPISELFGGKREWARMSAQQYSKSKCSRVSYGQDKLNYQQGTSSKISSSKQ